MATFTAISGYTLTGTFKDESHDHTIPTSRIGKNLRMSWTSGTGENQANQWWADQRTLASASENLDLVGGLTDEFGNTISFSVIVEILIWNRSATASPAEFLTISGNALAGLGLGGNSVIWPSGVMLLRAPLNGFPLADGTQDTLTISSVAAARTITYDIFIIGRV